MFEVPAAGKHHRHAAGIGGSDDLRIADRSTGLNRRRGARVRRGQQSIGKGE